MGDLAHLGAVIRMFAPEADVEAIKPIRGWTNRRGGNPTKWARLALDILRQASAPMTSREITRRIMREEGLAGSRTLYAIDCSLQVTLDKRVGEGIARVAGSPKRWIGGG